MINWSFIDFPLSVLKISTVMDWMRAKKVDLSDYGVLVRKNIVDGKCTLIAGIYTSSEQLRDRQVHESVTLADDLKRKFSWGRNKVRVEI